MSCALIDYVKKIARHVLPPSIARTNRQIGELRNDYKKMCIQLDALKRQTDNLCSQAEKLRSSNSQLENQIAKKSGEVLSGIQTLEQFHLMNIRPREHAAIVDNCVVSIASYSKRIKQIAPMLTSVLYQTVLPELIVLCLPLDDFPHRFLDLPSDIRWILGAFDYEIHWVKHDLGPHNKYFSTMQQYPNCCVITLDDDACYQPNLIETLWKAHEKFPGCVIAPRTHICKFDTFGKPLPYLEWELEQSSVINVPSSKLVPTGLGGVLYPPNALPKSAFDESTIIATCKNADDLWLKIMTASNHLKVVNPDYIFAPYYIANSQQSSLYKTNRNQGGNDSALKALAALRSEPIEEGLRWMRSN